MARRLLLVTPTFHDYWLSIKGAFERRGYDVSVCRYDARESIFSKLHHKMRHELPAIAGISTMESERAYATEAARRAVSASRPDVVVTIKGDVLDAPFYDTVDAQTPHHVLWLYDELRRMVHSDASLRRASGLVTYSPLDQLALIERGYPTTLVHNAFDPEYGITPMPPSNEFTFIGARYPSRAETLMKLQAAGMPVRAYGRQWSHHPIDRARTWQYARPDLPANRDISRHEAYGVMAASAATLNIHDNQDGFTMRTYEAPGSGALQFIDRTDVAELYEPDVEIACYTNDDELLDLCHRAQRDQKWANRIREAGKKRTLADHTWDRRVGALETLWG